MAAVVSLRKSPAAIALPVCAALVVLPSLFLFCGINSKIVSTTAPLLQDSQANLVTKVLSSSKSGRLQTLKNCLSFDQCADPDEAFVRSSYALCNWRWNFPSVCRFLVSGSDNFYSLGYFLERRLRIRLDFHQKLIGWANYEVVGRLSYLSTHLLKFLQK